jgi:hypothetical protein
MPKLFSECRGVKQEECYNNPICIYTNGKKYKYCRLSGRYILDKETKRVVLKEKKEKKNKTIKKKVINQKVLNQESIQKNASKKIIKFMRDFTFKRKSNYLSKVCLDSGLCLAFGTESKRIKDFFNGFKGLEFIQPPIKRIGNPSNNGFVQEIHYKREKYDAFAVLKSSMKTYTDNLYYEFLIGKELNSLISVLPCFVETYGIFKYKNSSDWKHAKNTKLISKNILFNGLENIEFLNPKEQLITSCQNSKYLAILIQHFKNVLTVKELINYPLFIKDELPYVLFQVYASLSMMSSFFTHYDLHWSNVLLYQPLNNSYIEYHYHSTDGSVVSFKSFYMAKIIDYGRCYLDKTSKNIYKKLCNEEECEPTCGKNVGYEWLDDFRNDQNKDHIFSQNKNNSHDLRLLNMLKFNDNIQSYNPELCNMVLNRVVYEDHYGTTEKSNSGLPKRINNINDAFIMLKKYLEMPNTINNNNNINMNYDKLGDLHIFMNFQNMRFIKHKI